MNLELKTLETPAGKVGTKPEHYAWTDCIDWAKGLKTWIKGNAETCLIGRKEQAKRRFDRAETRFCKAEKKAWRL